MRAATVIALGLVAAACSTFSSESSEGTDGGALSDAGGLSEGGVIADAGSSFCAMARADGGASVVACEDFEGDAPASGFERGNMGSLQVAVDKTSPLVGGASGIVEIAPFSGPTREAFLQKVTSLASRIRLEATFSVQTPGLGDEVEIIGLEASGQDQNLGGWIKLRPDGNQLTRCFSSPGVTPACSNDKISDLFQTPTRVVIELEPGTSIVRFIVGTVVYERPTTAGKTFEKVTAQIGVTAVPSAPMPVEVRFDDVLLISQ